MATTIESIKVETREIKWLVEQLKNGALVVDDSFQRRYVWTRANQISLMETILLGYPIPEIYLWIGPTDPDSGKTTYSIIDGQQRLGAVFKFLSGDYKLTASGLEFKSADYRNKLFLSLADEQRSTIWKYPFSVRFVSDKVSRDEIVKMFLRLNSGNISLNPQELRNAAFNGKFIELSAEIADHSFWLSNRMFTITDLRRMLDVQFVSSILIFFRKGIDEETDQSTLNRVYDLYNDDYLEADQDRALFERLLKDADTIIGGNESIRVLLRRKTHLYTLLITLYHFQNIGVPITSAHAKAYEEFVGLYNTDNLTGSKYQDQINEYKVLSNEGVQKRANRLRRFEILRDYFTDKVP
jgi:hypothetical protein